MDYDEMTFDEVLEEVMKEPKKEPRQVKYELRSNQYPQLIKTESGYIGYFHEEYFVVGIMDET